MSDKESRDDFLPAVKELLAKRAGFICSYPGCKRLTVAVSSDRKSGLTMVGVAAHITAAAPGGPRFDAQMSSDERSSESNGIWACQVHGKLIDDNPSRCTIEELRRWKAQHEDWVFRRVESGTELHQQGVVRISLRNVGPFKGEFSSSIGRHNVVFGNNEAGKTTLCQAVAAFSGEPHWSKFDNRFGFVNSPDRPFLEISHQNMGLKSIIRLSNASAQVTVGRGKARREVRRVHIEVDGGVRADWPISQFTCVHLDMQLHRERGEVRDTFRKGLRYLAAVLRQPEEVIWDSLRDEVFNTSLFGYRFRRVGAYAAEMLVPDGRKFYVPSGGLSSGELHIAYLDVVCKLVSISRSTGWLLLIDSGFFSMLDEDTKKKIFHRLQQFEDGKMQSIVCVHSEKDAQTLKDASSESWIGASALGKLTLHAFL